MDTFLLIIIGFLFVFILAGFGIIFYNLHNIKKDKAHNENILRMQGQIENLSQTIRERLQETNQSIQKQFSESIEIVKDVTAKLTKLDETNKQIMDYTLQLRKLEDILKSPKQRGILGEFYLESMLSQVFAPNQYKTQYSFPNGKTVDAVIFIKEKILPIDSKFSLEKYEEFIKENNAEKAKILEKYVFRWREVISVNELDKKSRKMKELIPEV